MDRRSFLKSVLSASIASTVKLDSLVENLLLDTAKLTDSEFVTYIIFSMNMYVNNPAHCAIITDIGEK